VRRPAAARFGVAAAEPFAASFSSLRVRFLISGPPLQLFFLVNQGPFATGVASSSGVL
jgi:hypothetical protein